MITDSDNISNNSTDIEVNRHGNGSEDHDRLPQPATSAVEEGLVADSSLQRATLTRSSARQQLYRTCLAAPDKQASSSGGVFWALVAVLLLLALSNLALTFFAMGVLRLGAGMESIEFITGVRPMLKLFGLADLGVVQQRDGLLSAYQGDSLDISSIGGQVSIGVNTIRPSSAIHVGPHSIHINNVDKFQVLSPSTGTEVFSTQQATLAVPQGVRSLHVHRAQVPRVASPTHSDLDIRADTTVRIKGNEGVSMSGRSIEWNADQDIFLRSLNGSLVLDGGSGGIFVEVNNLPLAGPVDHLRDRGQYKLCVCRFKRPDSVVDGHLYRVPVPLDNTRRSREHQINCASFTNPCMMM